MSPALLRQATYGSMRYGLYTPIKTLLGVDPARAKHEIPLLTRVFAGAASGALASAICNPADLIKVQAAAPRPNGTRTHTGTRTALLVPMRPPDEVVRFVAVTAGAHASRWHVGTL